MRAISTHSSLRGASRASRAAAQPRARSVKAVVSQMRSDTQSSPAAAVLAAVVAAALPLLPVSGAMAVAPQWQPVVIVADEEPGAPVAEASVVDEEPFVESVGEAAVAEDAEAAAPTAAAEEEVAVPVVEEEAAPAVDEEAVKEEVVEVLEEEIPEVEAEIATITDEEVKEAATDVVEVVEEEAAAADEELEKGVPPPNDVAQLLDTIQSQLQNLRSQFAMPSFGP